MTREEKIAKARELRNRDWTNVAIGKALGVSTRAIFGWLREVPYPQRECIACEESFRPVHGKQRCCSEKCRAVNGRARRRRAEMKACKPCCDCGEAMGPGSSRRDRKRCLRCNKAHERKSRDERRAEIEALWNRGYSLKEIAASLASTPKSISVEIAHMREDGGYDLPYRRQYSKPLYPEQVAA